MGWFFKFLAVVLVLGLIFYVQPSDRQESIRNWFKVGTFNLFERAVSDEPVEGTIEGEGGVLDVVFRGRPVKEFDCVSDFDCEYVSGCYLKSCACDPVSGNCFSLL